MYPYVMKNNLFPYKLLTVCENPKQNMIERLKSNNELALSTIAEVEISTDTETFPKRMEHGLTFPLGDYTTTLCGPELIRALNHNVITGIRRYAMYALADLFSEYVNYFWTRRLRAKEAGNTVESDLCKLFLNSLYGKFGQKSPQWEDEPNITPPTNEYRWLDSSLRTGKIAQYRAIGELVQRQVPRDDDPKSFCAIAAYVTTYAREYILSMIKAASFDHTYYVATDSLIVDDVGLANLAQAGFLGEKTLGKLSHKASGEYLRIEALHHWEIGSERKRGSGKKTAEWIDHHTLKETRFEALPTSFRRGTTPGVITYPSHRTFSLEYHKGIVGPDGRVSPLILGEIPSHPESD